MDWDTAQPSDAWQTLVDITGIQANVAKNMMTMFSLEQAVELACQPDFDASFYGGTPQSDEDIARQMSAQGASSSRPSGALGNEDEIRAPIPAKRERLYGNYQGESSYMPTISSSRPSNNEINAFGEARNSNVGRYFTSSSKKKEQSNGLRLGQLYEAPTDILFRGSFQKGLETAQKQSQWLLLNLQSNAEFASHQLNRDTWSDPTLKSLISTTFIFIQRVADSEEGEKIQSNYRLYELPVIAIIDPITGSAMSTLTGFQSAERLMETFVPFMDVNPEHPSAHRLANIHKARQRVLIPPQPKDMTEDEEIMAAAIKLSMSANEDGANESLSEIAEIDPQSASGLKNLLAQQDSLKESQEEVLQKDPKDIMKEAMESLPPESECTGPTSCKVKVRMPDGKSIMRSFLKEGTIGQLRSFCIGSSLEAASGKSFDLLVHSGPGPRGPELALKDDASTIEAAGIANSLVAMIWR